MEYMISVFVNYTRKTMMKVYPTEEEVLQALDLIPLEYKPELIELSPPKEERYTRTIRPSTISAREEAYDWKPLMMKKCQCGAMNKLKKSRSTGQVKCWECLATNPQVKSYSWKLGGQVEKIEAWRA